MRDFDFEVYKRTSMGARKRHGETVTIQRRGLISFSDDAYARIGSPEAVVFLVDAKARLLGFRAGVRGEYSAYAVRSAQHLVSGVAVCKFMGADTQQARRYPLICGEDGPPYIDLKESGVPVTSNRRRGGPS
jgi:hypothetical protein